MKIKTALYVTSAVRPEQFPALSFPEIAFVGRSNVGKSSLINTLTNIKSLAKTSSTPGKTQMINFFQINDNLLFADLPGYGFSKVPKSVQKEWRALIESYLEKRKNLKGVVHCIDIRHAPTELDCMMREWLVHQNIASILALTKADKISRGARSKNTADILKKLGADKNASRVVFSIKTREGKNELLREIALLAGLIS